ncbi:MAG TPA: hypothetical protein VI875_03455 [Candidatus Norongarragalinales archaeon]|nr:hypothetical protein [Candidatus Norongarragalinales archaeon]
MKVYTIDELAKEIPPFNDEGGKEKRQEFFRKIIEWGNYTNDEYPFEKSCEKIMETVLQVKGDDRIYCMLELLSTIQVSQELHGRALKEAERIIENGRFSETEKQNLGEKLSQAKKKRFDSVLIP